MGLMMIGARVSVQVYRATQGPAWSGANCTVSRSTPSISKATSSSLTPLPKQTSAGAPETQAPLGNPNPNASHSSRGLPPLELELDVSVRPVTSVVPLSEPLLVSAVVELVAGSSSVLDIPVDVELDVIGAVVVLAVVELDVDVALVDEVVSVVVVDPLSSVAPVSSTSAGSEKHAADRQHSNTDKLRLTAARVANN